MADSALHDSPAHDPDAPPSSAGSTGHPGALEPRPGPAPMSEELKGRLDKVVYSDVRNVYGMFMELGHGILMGRSLIYRSVSPLS